MQIDKENITKVAFVCCERFGDLLCTMPLISHWNRMYPQTSVTVVASEACASLLPFLYGYDNSVVVPNTSIRKKDIKFKTLWKIRRDRKAHFDLAISCSSSFSGKINMLLFAFKAKQRVACIKTWYNLSKYLLNQPILPSQVQKDDVHEALARFKILFPEFNEVPKELYPRLILPQKPLPDIPGLQPFFGYTDSPIIFVSVSNHRLSSFFGVRSYVDVINSLHAERHFRVLISSLPQDLMWAEAIAKQIKPPSFIVCTKELLDLLLILNKVDLVFVGDGGLMHMAAALGKYQVVLFGKTRVLRWHPLSEKAICLSDPEHVVKISKGKILAALKEQLKKLENEKSF